MSFYIAIIALAHVLLLGIFIYKQVKSRRMQYQTLLTALEGRIHYSLIQVRCTNFTFGLQNRDYLFSNCDIHLTADAIIILGYTNSNVIEMLSTPIILTKSVAAYENEFDFARVFAPKKVEITTYNDAIFLDFGKGAITSTNVEITLRCVSEEGRSKIGALSL
jgi:hypothetical protein